MQMHHFNANPSTGKVYFKSFNDANTKQMQQYIWPTSIDDQQDSFIIHIGKNGVLRDVERANDWWKLQSCRSDWILQIINSCKKNPSVTAVIRWLNNLIENLWITNDIHFIYKQW